MTNYITSRNSDKRIELTRILKEYTNYFSDATPTAYATERIRDGREITIYRNLPLSDSVSTPDGIMEYDSNIEGRVFYTPENKKRAFNIQVTRKYIHIS